MIRIHRKHYSDRAFRKPLVVTRCRGRLSLRLTFKRRSPLGDSYELEVHNPKVSRAKRTIVTYEVIEHRHGKWVLGRRLRIERGGKAVCGGAARGAVPSAVYTEVLQLISALDAAVDAETPEPPCIVEPPPKRAKWRSPRERKQLEIFS